YNAAFLCAEGRIVGVQRKRCLPNYDVFDERRYFQPARRRDLHLFHLGGIRLGISICEDMWVDEGPLGLHGRHGVQLHVNLSASPYHAGKGRVREELACRRARENRFYLAFCNQVGGQDDLVFDGGSLVASPEGEILAEAPPFEEAVVLLDLPLEAAGPVPDRFRPLPLPAPGPRPELPPPPRVRRPAGEEPGEIYRALSLGLSDYFHKNRFRRALVALSGGIDSALVLTLAADALGPEAVAAVMMPSRISSRGSVEDAQALVANLGVEAHLIPIAPIVDAFEAALAPIFAGLPEDVTEENIQSRVRGTLLMALSNKFGALVLATGNKSEMAVGYATLYGDMAGGLAVIADVPKTLVYRLCRWRNRARGAVIPEAILTKPPSAELRPGQLDTDSLPPYEVLDPILDAYIEEHLPVEAIVARGFPEAVVRDVVRRVDRAEYKRQQAAPGLRITPKAFGTGRRMPITNRFTVEWEG
ncbi:MAG: NAD+ synthase, partial [Nitrospirae bacterium]